jgi:GntR family transcriptional regulator/MocR family aminotransferase
MQPADMVHPPVYGLPALRAEIAAYLQVSRGIDCSPSQVFVTSGYRHTLTLIAQALLKAGDRSGSRTRDIRRRATCWPYASMPVPVPVDGTA